MLSEIRRHIEDGSLSFIVGAGFSKNISPKFPLWDELLDDLLKEMYPGCDARNKIAEKGYLGIASEYVRRKGFHEAIDLYIEDHMPYLRSVNGGYGLILKGEVIDSSPFLDCHRKLLGLGTKNIFTFNYDNTLDVLANVQDSANLLRQRREAEQKLGGILSLLEKYKAEYSKLHDSGKIKNIPEDAVSATGADYGDYKRINEIIDSFGMSLKTFSDAEGVDRIFNDNLNAINTEIARQKSIKEHCEEKRKDKYQLITNAYQISLTDGCQNIYKLHGNLRTEDNSVYEFDGDRHMQYVITEEDYSDYPSKHEAFVNLMRISLLKGAFCLIGFSGDDPNFMAWITWVKDILDKNSDSSSGSRAIYYINSDKRPLPADKRLLLKNHYIEIVNLSELFPEANSHCERMNAFFDSIRRDDDLYKRYEDCWREIDFQRDNAGISPEMEDRIEVVYNLSDFNRIPNQFGIGHYHRTTVFSRKGKILNSNIDKTLCAKLLYSSIHGELMPVTTVLTRKDLEFLLEQVPETKEKYQKLLLRDNILLSGDTIDGSSDDDVNYEAIMGNLFHLRFNTAKSMIDEWHPQSGFNQMRRFMLLSIYDGETDSDAITSLIVRDKFECLQDYKFALDLLPGIRGRVIENNGTVSLHSDLQARRENLEKHSPRLVKVWEVLDGLVKEIKGKEELHPYGNKSQSVRLDSFDVPLMNSFKILQMFLELGMPTEAHNVLMLGKEKWQIVCGNLYEMIPYPCLYFSLLYGNSKDLLKKIAQDYIYSNKIRRTLPELLDMMLHALMDDDCPFNVKEAIYIMAPIFMRAVPAERWEPLFEKIYDSFRLTDTDYARRAVNEECDFISTGVRLSGGEKFKHKVLLTNLRLQAQIGAFNNRLIIDAVKNIDLNDEEHLELNKLCRIAETPTHFYVLMNLIKWIDVRSLTERLMAVPDETLNDCTLLEATGRYADGCPALQARLRKIILQSSLLWQTGINDGCTSVSHYGYTLEISEIQEVLEFSDEEILEIYDKMKAAFRKIDAITKKWKERTMWNSLDDWSFILIEMQNFMLKNKKLLSSLSDYSGVKRSVTRLLNQGRGGNSISSLIVSDNTNNAIEWLVTDIIRIGVKSYQYEYVLLTNRIIYADSQFLHSCFVHFGWALTKYENQFDRNAFRPILKSILEKYKPYYSGDKELKWDIAHAGKDVVERELIKIYNVYKLWGGRYPFWEKYQPRYYV